MNYGKAACTLSLITLGLTSYLAFETHKQQQELVEREQAEKREIRTNNRKQARAIIASDQRIANIINYDLTLNNLKDLTPPLVDKTLKLAEEFSNDKLDDAFFSAVTNVGFSDEVIRTSDGYQIRSKWTMFAKPESPFYKSFPVGSALVFHNETIPYTSCENSAPQIVFAPVSSKKAIFDADFIKDDQAKAYRITFKGDFDPIKDRLIIQVICPSTETTSKTETNKTK